MKRFLCTAAVTIIALLGTAAAAQVVHAQTATITPTLTLTPFPGWSDPIATALYERWPLGAVRAANTAIAAFIPRTPEPGTNGFTITIPLSDLWPTPYMTATQSLYGSCNSLGCWGCTNYGAYGVFPTTTPWQPQVNIWYGTCNYSATVVLPRTVSPAGKSLAGWYGGIIDPPPIGGADPTYIGVNYTAYIPTSGVNYYIQVVFIGESGTWYYPGVDTVADPGYHQFGGAASGTATFMDVPEDVVQIALFVTGNSYTYSAKAIVPAIGVVRCGQGVQSADCYGELATTWHWYQLTPFFVDDNTTTSGPILPQFIQGAYENFQTPEPGITLGPHIGFNEDIEIPFNVDDNTRNTLLYISRILIIAFAAAYALGRLTRFLGGGNNE